MGNHLSKEKIAANAGLAIKTINNKRGTSKREIVVEESLAHFDQLLKTVDDLCDTDVDIDLSITFNNVTVHLNLNETLIVINALAIRRSQIRGGSWSAFGKNVEEPLLRTMCVLFQVPEEFYSSGNRDGLREVDFCLKTKNYQDIRCEVKLMGKGNPEGADSTFARNSDVFIASTLSETNKTQLDAEGVKWVELRQSYGFLKFEGILNDLNVPHTPIPNDRDDVLKGVHYAAPKGIDNIDNLISEAINKVITSTYSSDV